MAAAALADAVVVGVLHDGLKHILDHLLLLQGGVNADVKADCVVHADVEQRQIAYKNLPRLPDRDHVLAVIEGQPEKVGKVEDDV